jgi:hypothetical protein
MTRLTIRRFEISSLARWGCMTGAAMAVLPACACSWLTFRVIHAIRQMIEGWRAVNVDLLFRQTVSLDVVGLLHLEGVLNALQTVDAQGVFGMLLMTVVFVALLGIFIALVLSALGLGYNALAHLVGGIAVEVEERRN